MGSDPSVPFVYGLNVDSLKDVTVSGFPSYSVSPIPEPSTWALIALGLVCVALAGRRHHRGEALAAVA
ncbi:MAG: PEP-CTERM sorting domain-containing protein [Rubrivivax sp.]|nr:PEP-CTERM sorting domain-containing protein [Rubrivivax sp.]